MSPEEKLKRASIFKKMALRDKLESSRKRQSLAVLLNELSKNQDVRDQLENLVEQAVSTSEAQTAMALHSASWYNTKVRDQLELVQNRCQHLEIEISEIRKNLAHSERRRVRKTEKAEALHKQVRQNRQDREDAALSERGRRPRIR